MTSGWASVQRFTQTLKGRKYLVRHLEIGVALTYHWFADGASLCRRVKGYKGNTTQNTSATPFDCKSCRNALLRLRRKKCKKGARLLRRGRCRPNP